ncbi:MULTISPECIES: RNA methyltransferase [unclassified Lentimicrobium]|uniref:TrmH family RNA methyltransferase n=1 Tax=unclassified Lentimicrobium TaxID=2677434 RepID=UPI00155771C7|nr:MULTISPECIES: RNA methyltransferase [unclassified Lentimicrobium]NPD46475.1 RNA methyltransferase [Lentimicrobium sp. S6]NPD85981.1 RNA methyltransferase [Lentimicrobium sp. L6]
MEISKSEIKLINAIKTSHGRKKHGVFLVEGPKMIEELLQSNFDIKLLIATDNWYLENNKIVNEPFARVVKSKDLERVSQLSTANQVLAVVNSPMSNELHIPNDELILVLDTIQDPGNLGTIIRTADWFGINTILCSKETTDAYSPKVVQSSMGSVFRKKIYYTELKTALSSNSHQLPIYGSLLQGENIYELSLNKKGFIVIGNESKGISKEIQKLITQAIYIPQADNSKAESLNASIATGIILSIFSK